MKWEPGDAIDWVRSNVTVGPSDEYCGNCGLDFPGCGCPRDCQACLHTRTYCGHLDRDHESDRERERQADEGTGPQ
jgi:hypothetical protein